MTATDTTLQGAVAAHKAGRLGEAEAGYRNILQGQPDNADALNFLGLLHFHQGQADSAVELLQRSVEANPDNPHARINLGNVLMARDDHEGAQAAFRRATELSPDLAITWYNLGVCQRQQGHPEAAADSLRKTIDIDPRHIPAHNTLAQILCRLRRYPQAAEVYRGWLAAEPENPVARHMLAALAGDAIPKRADDDYVRTVFDQFADSFDENLSTLGYRAPKLLADALLERSGAQPGGDILDAGCGTGLCGPLLRAGARRLEGVDLSPGMIEKARLRGVYDELAVAELCAFMRSRPACYDVVMCADTLVYFGALGEAIAAARTCLRNAGVFAFTLERLETQPPTLSFHLEPHGRYSHAEWYVRDVLTAAGFSGISMRNDTLRSEGGEPVIGHVVTASIPGRASAS